MERDFLRIPVLLAQVVRSFDKARDLSAVFILLHSPLPVYSEEGEL